MHMIFMDSDNKLGMNLDDTYFVTENANERLYKKTNSTNNILKYFA